MGDSSEIDQVDEGTLQANPRKHAVKRIYFITGVAIIVAFALLITSSIRGLVVIRSLNLDLTFVLWYLLFFVGLAFLTKTFTIPLTNRRENSIALRLHQWNREPLQKTITFWSVPWSRLLAGSISAGIGVLNIVIFGLGTANSAKLGQILFLGGPSVAYLTGIYPVLFGFMLLGYCIFSVTRLSFGESEHWFVLLEQKLPTFHLTEIPKSEVAGISIRNIKFGGKFGWVLIFVPYLILNIGYGMIFLYGPRATTASLFLGWVLLGNGLCIVPVLLLLLGWRHHFFEIMSPTKRYEKYFFPPVFNREKLVALRGIFDLNFPEITTDRSDTPPAALISMNKSVGNWTRLLTGLILIGVAAFARATYTGLGMLAAWGAVLYGTVLVTGAFTGDLPAHGFPECRLDIDTGEFHYAWRRGRNYVIIKVLHTRETQNSIGPRPLDAFDFVGSAYLCILLGIQVGQAWYFATGLAILGEIALGTTFSAGIMLLLIFYATIPAPVVRIAAESLSIELPARRLPMQSNAHITLGNTIHSYVSFLRSKDGRIARWRLFMLLALFFSTIGITAAWWALA